MANINLTAASAKTTVSAEMEALNEAGLTATNKGVVTVPDEADLPANSTIDVSESAFFKTVSVGGGYTGKVNVVGNPNAANTFYAGGGGGSLFGGSVYVNDKDKEITSADKYYGGAGDDVFVYEVKAGKDQIYNYSNGNNGNNDVILVRGLTESQTMSFVDKSGGLTVTINDENDTADGGKAGTTAKTSVLTIDGKSKVTTDGFNGFVFRDENGGETVYGALGTGVSYGVKGKNNAEDTSSLILSSLASGTVNAGNINSAIKNITAVNESPVYIIGNANANKITIGSGGGTIDGSYGTKATNDTFYGNATGAVTFIYDAVNGGKDVIGDAKLTQYNYKSGDKIVITGGEISEDSIAYKGSDVVITIDKSNSLTVKNGLGKAIKIVDESDEALTTNENGWGETLPTGLNYDSSKFSKITADNGVITVSGYTEERRYVEAGVDADGDPLFAWKNVKVYNTISLGGGNAYNASVKTIDLSASSAPVYIDTTGDDHSLVSAISFGKDGGTAIANEAVAQTFTAGAGGDTVITDASKAEIERFKGDTANNLGVIGTDALVINNIEDDDEIAVTESGKNLVVSLNGTTLITLKNHGFNANNKLYIRDGNGTLLKEYPFTVTGVSYGTKGTKEDKTSLVASGAVNASVVSADDFGGKTIKTVNALEVTSATNNGLELIGSEANNTMYAPTATSLATTLNGAAGSDALYSGAGKTTYVFQAQVKGKKDTIYNYKDGDVIVIDQSILEDTDGAITAEFGTDENGKGTIEYASGNSSGVMVNGFNDTKADVVVSVNKSNTITIKNAAGKNIVLSDGSGLYTFGHVLPDGLAYDAKNTTVSLSGGSYKGTVNLADTSTYYSTIKKVDLKGNTAAAAIYGNTIANEFIAGAAGSTMYGGAAFNNGTTDKPKIVATADKLTGGDGTDYFLYSAGDGKDQFLSFGAGDVVSLGADIKASDLTITDKKNVLTVAIGGSAVSSDKTDTNYSGNSTFTITKSADTVPVSFVFADSTADKSYDFTYGSMGKGVSIDSKYASLTVDTSAKTTVNAAVINSQPKVIDAKTSSGEIVLIGNANADAIYAGSGGSTMFGGTAGTKAVKDQLYGGSGKDVFLFSSQGGEKGKETDIVYNYNAANGDVIVLEKEPDLVKADGKTITLTFNDETTNAKGNTVTVASTLQINGVNNDDGVMKKFDPITASTEVTFAIGDFLDDDGNIVVTELTSVLESAKTYTFDNTTEDSSLKSGKGDWGDPGISEAEASPQFASNVQDYWFTDNNAAADVVGSELDEILDVKGSTANVATQFNADSYFTQVGEDKQASALALAAARHRAQK